MTTLFDLLIQSCGLSQREAADFLGVRLDTIKSCVSGRRQPPEELLIKLATLGASIDNAASKVLAQIDTMVAQHGAQAEIDLGVASDDAEAQRIGWPCVGAQCASLGLLVARGMEQGYRFRLSPRGSTVPTAAAADAHEKLARKG